MATKVTLRKKKINNGMFSLYLDFYPPITDQTTGEQSRREFLKMYVLEKPKTPMEKLKNEETARRADKIRVERQNELDKPEIYNSFEKERLHKKELGEKCFVEYFRKLASKRKNSNQENWVSALKYLESYTGGKLKFADLNEIFLEDFKDYLLTTKSNKSDKTTISQNTASSYFNKVKASLKQAYKEGFLQTDLNAKTSPIKETETRREYLTLEELSRLANTPCNNDLLKRASLFSALTGMRFSDIAKLVWAEVEHIQGQGCFINFCQKKTKGIEVLPVSEQAFKLLGERKEPKDQVFDGLKYSAHENRHLNHWIGNAGITKKITFHCFRHTFATLQLSHGTDIYTVSKMLGHRELKTTQIYAKIVDDTKRKAADKIKLNF